MIMVDSPIPETIEPRHEKTCLRGFATRPAQPQGQARGLKFRLEKLEVLYYLNSE